MRLALSLLLVVGSLFLVPQPAWAQNSDATKLAAGLSAATADEQHAAADALAELRQAGEGAVPQLLTALESKDAELRWRAARALGLIGNVKAAEGLRKHTTDASAMVRAQAIYALGRLRAQDQASLTAIVARLTDPDAQVRRVSVAAMLMIRADRERVVPLVVKLLEDSDSSVVMPALHALAGAGEAVVPALTEALDHKEARYWACLVLAEIGPKAKAAVPALEKVVADERPEVKLQALVTLGEIGPDAKAAVPTIIKAAGDAELSVQYAATFALGRIADPSAAAVLAKATMAEDPFLRQLAIWASAKVAPADAEKVSLAVKTLVQGLIDEQQSHRAAAARGLLDLNQSELVSKEIDALIPTLDEEKFDRYVAAFSSLGARVVPRATEVLTDPKRRARGMKILARVGPEAAPAVPHLVGLLKDEDPQTRTDALFTLAAIGPGAAPAIGPITQALADPDRDVMLTAGYALGKLGPEAKTSAPALAKLLASDDGMVKLTGVWALLRIDPKNPEYLAAAVPALTNALKNEHGFVRAEAAMTLGDVGEAAAGALPALEAATRDSVPAVRAAAVAAVKKIKG